jgi:hypothetical protein
MNKVVDGIGRRTKARRGSSRLTRQLAPRPKGASVRAKLLGITKLGKDGAARGKLLEMR